MSTMKAHDTQDPMLVHCRRPEHSHTIEHGINTRPRIHHWIHFDSSYDTSIKLVPNTELETYYTELAICTELEMKM